MTEQSLGFPQLILIFILGGLTIRYFFFSSKFPSSPNHSPNHASDSRAREADVETIQQMFPQISRRSVMWDLSRNGGNVSATTERILSGRGLETPPQSFQPSLPTTNSSSTSQTMGHKRAMSSQPDLITRYDLRARLAEDKQWQEESKAVEDNVSKVPQKQTQAWSTNKAERQALLKKRREDMILAARRKMEAKVTFEALKTEI